MISNRTIVSALRELENKSGQITANGLVEASKDPSHPLHSKFMWNDDARAAHEHRLDIARSLINSVRVELKVGRHTIAAIGYVKDPASAPHQGYIAVSRVRSDRDVSQSVLLAEVDRIKSALERAREIATALSLEDELQDSIDSIAAFRFAVVGSAPATAHMDA